MALFREYALSLSAAAISTLRFLFGFLFADWYPSRALTVGILVLVVSVGLTLYAQHRRRSRAAIVLNGASLESLSAARVLRRVNQTLVIRVAENSAIIADRDIVISWRCDGYCLADQERAIEFSIDSDNNVPFSQMACFAYDLLRDPQRKHRIRPILVGPDGKSKKVAVPFLEPLVTGQPFTVLLTWSSQDCMRDDIDYYTTTFSFNQERVARCITRLIFLKDRPTWVRVYDSDVAGNVTLLRELVPSVSLNHDDSEYRDVVADVPAKSTRIYLFRRSTSEIRKDVRPAA